MSVDLITAVLLIGVPVAFNLAFFGLGRAFDYPSILRRELRAWNVLPSSAGYRGHPDS